MTTHDSLKFLKNFTNNFEIVNVLKVLEVKNTNIL